MCGFNEAAINRSRKVDVHIGPAARVHLASMRPRSIDRGRGETDPRIGHAALCFNEAAINRSRKGRAAHPGRVPGFAASMRPRSIDRGRAPPRVNFHGSRARLQ